MPLSLALSPRGEGEPSVLFSPLPLAGEGSGVRVSRPHRRLGQAHPGLRPQVGQDFFQGIGIGGDLDGIHPEGGRAGDDLAPDAEEQVARFLLRRALGEDEPEPRRRRRDSRRRIALGEGLIFGRGCWRRRRRLLRPAEEQAPQGGEEEQLRHQRAAGQRRRRPDRGGEAVPRRQKRPQPAAAVVPFLVVDPLHQAGEPGGMCRRRDLLGLPDRLAETLAGDHLFAAARAFGEVRLEEMVACQRLGEAIRQTEEIAPTAHPARLARLMERIDDEERDHGRGWLRALLAPWHGLASSVRATPPLARGALVAQLLLLAALGSLLLRGPQQTAAPAPAPAPEYQTLSQSDPAPAVPPAAARLRLVFAEGTTEKEARDLLLGIRGQ